MNAADRPALIERYIERYRALPDAIASLLADAALDAAAGPGEWSARQIVHHLGDSELMDAARLRLIAAEEQPEITPYDETLFAERLGAERPIAPSLAAIRAARESGAEILQRLETPDFERSGIHPEHDEYTLAIWLERAVEHGEAHLNQLRRALGK